MTECMFCVADAAVIFIFFGYPVADKPRQFALCEAHLKTIRRLLCGSNE